MWRPLLAFGVLLCSCHAGAEGLTADRLGVVFDRADPASVRVAQYYAARRHIPAANLVGLLPPEHANIGREALGVLRRALLEALPSNVQSLLIVWQQPYAVECMSITTAMAAGFQANFCEPGCGATMRSALYDSQGWLPADTSGWLPAMLLPTRDEALARAVIDRGVRSDGTAPGGTVYLVRTQDAARNVRAAGFNGAKTSLAGRINVRELSTPVFFAPDDALGYFTGVAHVEELQRIGFLPGAMADHLTSTGGDLDNSQQMSVLAWLRQGATASYGAVSEPCNVLEKFPQPAVLMDHYLRGETMLESYWKSVVMPGQGLFIGEPLARPYGARQDGGR